MSEYGDVVLGPAWMAVPGAVSAVEEADGMTTITVRHECEVGPPVPRPLPWEQAAEAAAELCRLRRVGAKPRRVWRQAVLLRRLLNELRAK